MGRRPKGTVGELRQETEALKDTKETKALKATKEAKAAKETTEKTALKVPSLETEAEKQAKEDKAPSVPVTCESCIYFAKPYCAKNPPVVLILREVVDFNSARPLYKDRVVSTYPTCIIEMPCGEHKKK